MANATSKIIRVHNNNKFKICFSLYKIPDHAKIYTSQGRGLTSHLLIFHKITIL